MKKLNVSALALGIVLLGSAVGASSCGNRSNAVQKPVETPKVVVKAMTAALASVEQISELTGNVLPYAENSITPAMSARIDRILVDVGSRVGRGQVLARMDETQFSQAEVQFNNLEADLARYRKLYEEGGISKQQLDQLETQVSVSKHAIDNLKVNTLLTSPISGVVTERNYDPGDVYMPGKPILTVMQIDRVKVLVNVSESYFPEVKQGMPVDVKLDLYPGEAFPGKVTLVHPAIDAGTRTFTTEITIQNGNSKLRPGMFARVTLHFGTADHVLVPDVAVQKQVGSNERYAFVVTDGIARRRTLQVGRMIGNQYEILSGINDGEQVVVAGAQKLLDQSPVDVSM
ncbi:MAG: efflux RND transporter periplasmic adaptor subunit [Rikenellaceae bacterium]|jgi:RND family efflux transporter MFP subunit|nr:efflux RND transporter periplasmic adaptor subunit [Rikenellaceae bacterium]